MVNVKVGDTVFVLDGRRRSAEPIRGTVVKVARVWIEVHREGMAWGWRFRKDTQHEGGSIGYGKRFYTPEQWAEKLQRDAAQEFLYAQGIDIRFGSPWRDRMSELAALLGWTPPAADDATEA